MNIRLTSFAALLALSVLTACNTMEGLGQDVENAGDNLEDTAREEKNK